MSTKEVKVWKTHEIFAAGMESTDEIIPDYVLASDHLAAMAEKDAEIDELETSLANVRVNYNYDVVTEQAEMISMLHLSIARLNLSIARLKGTLEGIVAYAEDSDMRREFARKALEKLAETEAQDIKP